MAQANEPVAAPREGGSEEQKLPPLSVKDFTAYNRMAAQMDQFHNNFRLAWKDLQNACDTNGKRPGGLKPKQLINTGLRFCSQLDHHHSIEEVHIFPLLARKMPEFRQKKTLLAQHKKIHRGLEELEQYLEKCRSGEEDLELAEMKRLMDAFGEVLWAHLDDEVRTLGAENMRKYWTLDEMRALPM
ncbi:hypothetical protein BDV26DRAFT_279573 [Aspergillus bertholletiae]|uniref:Hemerythrin-like domain-containing protein n=1 Tax=Aspergillus bertholletiae TaxID=1226010 RepID=A0A5N7BF01_9EURO|nr:hypothetical protein BDV26DRAFT_279573 [Aspergillus bertholletiae]